MKKILKLIYKANRKTFKDLFVEELLEDVPNKVTNQAIEILGEKQIKFKKWLLYQAHWLQRRNVSDVKNADVTYGMLLQIKAMLHIISSVSPIEDEGVNTVQSVPKSNLDKELSDVNKFKKGISPRK